MKKANVYGNICSNIHCGLNVDTDFCQRVDRASQSTSDCVCNIETSRCVKKKNNKDFLSDIDIRKKKKYLVSHLVILY